MAKKKKLKKADLPEIVGGVIPDPFLEAFIGIWREIDQETGEMENVIRLVGPGEQGLPNYTIAKGMLAIAAEELASAYAEHAALGDEEY